MHQGNQGAVERLSFDGSADLKSDKRTRVTARQMFVLAYATQMDWLSGAGNLITGLEAYLDASARHPEFSQGYVHRLEANNSIAEGRQDTYDLAFFLLAYAWRFRALGDKQALQRAELLMRHLDHNFKGDRGGWEDKQTEVIIRRQNPHMHLFEAFIALYEATGSSKWLARAGEVFNLFETRFYDDNNEVLLEYFDAHWNPITINGHYLVEPGHMLEWVWLLCRYNEYANTPVVRYTEALYERALELGTDPNSGLLWDQVSPEGQVITASKRCWPMTELIKANIALAGEGHSRYESRAAEAIELLLHHYLKVPTPGSYIDRLDAQNKVIDHSAPASTLYHLALAAGESALYCRSQEID
ncbi:mannose-6-phosphate isomerase [Pseudomaricurvus alkylphenolicus]|uniref:AGE family epimerase/isomerase n=1 Tax=Pseudomaricurvus alkylphenolicus TaxID=1306991 RepID=UPI00141E65B0|nr:AGE family epimerase/isomerase [Pseudomaricurvus alkylphenolicus]NIB42162.1 mannose-6-phosphate isomerase [Pseudomaricurvus alkylphenolicus]